MLMPGLPGLPNLPRSLWIGKLNQQGAARIPGVPNAFYLSGFWLPVLSVQRPVACAIFRAVDGPDGLKQGVGFVWCCVLEPMRFVKELMGG